MFLLASYSGANAGKIGNETISSGDGDTLFSGSSFRNFDVDSSAKLDHRLQASNFDTHKDTDYLNEKKRKESRQAEDPTEATTAIMEGHAFDEWSRLRDLALIEATILSQSHLIPEFHYSWLYDPFSLFSLNYASCFAVRVYYCEVSHAHS